MVNVNLLTY